MSCQRPPFTGTAGGLAGLRHCPALPNLNPGPVQICEAPTLALLHPYMKHEGFM